MDYPGKLIRKTPLVPTQTSASGVWTMTEAMDAVKANSWPVAGTPLPMQQSLRFRNSATAYMTRTPSVAGNRQKFTLSYWVKPGIISSSSINPIIFCAGNASTRPTAQLGCFLAQASNNAYNFQSYNGSGYDYNFTTTQVFRDPSAWYHFVIAFDTTQATDTNRVKLYVNGSQVTAFSTASYPSQNLQLAINNSVTHGISTNTYNPGSSGDALDGYLAEMNFVDGQQLTPSSFGQTDPQTGVWQAIPYTGTYGTNGFYLPFKNPANVGLDYSGNANNWTANNFSTTPTYNYTSYTSGSGTYTVPAGVSSIQYLVVAGGGGGSGLGGGGAGGMLTGTLAVTPGQTIAYSVGTGGAGSPAGSGNNLGTSGNNSTFGGFTAIGGGGGAGYVGGGGSGIIGLNGGSGGGGGGANSGAGTGGSGTSGQGFAGGSGSTSGGTAGGGGGGAGTVGQSVTSNTVGGNGGTGITWINGTTYAGGGGGSGSSSSGTGGAGGGGNAGSYAGSAAGNGTANTGGGGGACYGGTPGGGNGGSGIVIVAYQTSASTYDIMADTPTQWLPAGSLNGNANARGNYCVWNPLNKTSNHTASDGNLTATSSSYGAMAATIGMTSGSWYWEVYITNRTSTNSPSIGYCNELYNVAGATYLTDTSNSGGINSINGNAAWNATSTAYGSALSTGDTVMFAFDATAKKMWVGKNGTWFNSGNPVTATNPWPYTITGSTFFPAVNCYTDTYAANFGQRPFTYQPPSGFLPLNTYNLPTSTIVKGNTVMDATTYTGNATITNISNSSGTLYPDFLWIKARSSATDNILANSNVGVQNFLVSNSTGAEQNDSRVIRSVTSGSFQLGTDAGTSGSNQNGVTYVGWQWQAGQGTTSSNTNGSITSTVSVNASAGFSIVTYTGTGANATVGHGLGVAPSMIILKNRSSSTNWEVYHSALGNGYYGYLNATNAFSTSGASTVWNTAPTSSVFGIGTSGDVNTNGSNYVAYCWAEIAGFSKFGSYTGNASSNGPFVYTGFRPRFILIKCTNQGAPGYDWFMYDTARDTYNLTTKELEANLTITEDQYSADIDILSNGFKLRNVGASTNGSGYTYIYAAFAENPFKNALAR